MKALKQIGIKKAIRYVTWTFAYLIFRALPLSPLRTFYLKLLGSKIGKNCVIHNIKFFNYYRGGFSNLRMGDCCFIGDDTLLDLAAPITLESHVTLAERVIVLTHLNVGYDDHPLQKTFPSQTNPVLLKTGCFVGAGVIVLDGVTIGEKTFIAAASLVKESLPASVLAAGVPAKIIRQVT